MVRRRILKYKEHILYNDMNINREKLGFLSYIGKIVRFINHHNPMYILISVVSLSMLGLLPIASIQLTQIMINSIQTGENNLKQVISILVVICLLNVLQAVINEGYSYYAIKVTLNLSHKINVMLLEKSARLALSDFENSETFDMISRAQNQTGAQILSFLTELLSIFQQLVTLGVTIWMIAKFRKWLIVLCILVPLIRFAVAVRIGKEQYNMRFKRTQKERKCGYIKYLFSTTQGMEELRIFQSVKRRIQQYSELQKEFIQQELNVEKKGNVLIIITEVLAAIVNGVSIAYCALQAFLGGILLGDAAAYIDYIEKTNECVENIFSGLQQIVNEILYVRLLVDFFELPEEKARDEKISRIQTVEFQGVSFGYGSEQILKDVSFTLHAGDFVKIIGLNGSGKTTLLKLLMGIYENYDGKILINGEELRTIDRNSYYEHLGCIFQNFEKYEDSIRTNITCDDIRYSEKEINQNIDLVGLHEKIAAIGGIDVVVGHWFGEQQLSGGEWQRIAIARSLTRNSDCLLLDEPDAALDAVSKERINKVLYKEAKRKRHIVIQVSHKMDESDAQYTGIYRLRDGKLIQEK